MSYVYLFESGEGLIKIGQAKSWQARLSDIRRRRRPIPVEPHSYVELDHDTACLVETWLHGKLRKHRVAGEWYCLPPGKVRFTQARLGQFSASPPYWRPSQKHTWRRYYKAMKARAAAAESSILT